MRIVDKLDDGVKFISANDGGVYDAAKHTVIWNIAKLAPFADRRGDADGGSDRGGPQAGRTARHMATVNNSGDRRQFDNDAETETNVVDHPRQAQ